MAFSCFYAPLRPRKLSSSDKKIAQKVEFVMRSLRFNFIQCFCSTEDRVKAQKRVYLKCSRLLLVWLSLLISFNLGGFPSFHETLNPHFWAIFFPSRNFHGLRHAKMTLSARRAQIVSFYTIHVVRKTPGRVLNRSFFYSFSK